jgi:hypothetical protein
METLFDEENHAVGDEITAYSPKLKSDTPHTIVSMYEGEIRRVQCQVSGEVHAYRKPRGETADGQGEMDAPPKKKLNKKMSWREAMASVSEAHLAACRPYSIRDTYLEMDLVSHPKFDIGFVTAILFCDVLDVNTLAFLFTDA